MPDSPALEEKRKKEIELLDLQLAQKRNELVPVDYAQDVVTKLLDGVRERLLAIPYNYSDDPELAEELRLQIVQALEDLQGEDSNDG